MSIYVEILVRAPMDVLWTHTQMPKLHQQWDLRFSRIDFLPRTTDGAPQRFRYSTRIGFGFAVTGEGETVGQRDLVDGIRFLTWYDYRTRFGLPGALFARLIFRPLIGWATAFSFDRLRLWVEHGVNPAHSLRQALVHLITRISLSTIIAYQGMIATPFNPLSLSLAVASLSAIDLVVLPRIPSAARCLRRPRRHHELNL